jgi:hypothetical protein
MLEYKQATEAMATAMKDQGLHFEVRMWQTPTFSTKLSFEYAVEIDARKWQPEDFFNEIEKFKNMILESSVVREKIASIEGKLMAQETKLDDLRRQIKHLQKFKNHYELQYLMQHEDLPPVLARGD